MVAIKNFLLAVFLGFNSFFIKTPTAITPTPIPEISLFPSATIAPTQSPLNLEVDLILIKSAFASKYGRKVADVVMTTTNYDGSHFVGNVSFRLAMEGGLLLSAKDANKNWVIVMDGNGQIPCEAIQPYHFPSSMVSECYNRSGKVVKLN